MSATYTPHRYGCLECDWERLRKWAIENHLIDTHTGPADMVDNIIKLTNRMEERIQGLNGQIKNMQSMMFQRAGAVNRNDDVE
jgi:hypothetical protein